VIIPETEFLQCTVVKCFLIVPDELLPIICCQRSE
jgi:hypothetical protein